MFILKPIVNHTCKSNIIALGKYILVIDNNNFYKLKTNTKTAIIIFETPFKFEKKTPSEDYYESVKNIANVKSIPFTEIIFEKNVINIIPDCTYRIEIYYHQSDAGIFISNSILEIGQTINLTRSEFGIIYGLTSNNAKPPKKHTLFNELRKIGFNEFIKIDKSKIQIITKKEKWLSINEFLSHSEAENIYREIITAAVNRRMNETENALLLSSGWDSTGLLALMRELKPRSSINCVFLKIISQKNGKAFNEYELSKVNKFAKYYGVELNIIEINYTDKNIQKFYDDNLIFFKNSCCFTLSALNHLKIFSELKKYSSKSAPVFCGEMSDGVHSFGFSQNISIFHENSFGFRYYSDKMMSYIYSPSFVRWIDKNRYSDELVWNILKENKGYDLNLTKKTLQKEELLFALFLSKERFPFIKRLNPFDIKRQYLNKFRAECFSTYFSNATTNLSERNIYSIYMQLYESFHWQGGSVMSIDEAARFNGFQVIYPFHDREFIKFMSTVPEKYGRGLELLPTKYLWKNFLEKNLIFPLDFHVGPHSYQYDVNPGADFHAQVLETKFGRAIREKAILNLKFLRQNYSYIFSNKTTIPALTKSEVMRLSFQYAIL